MTLPTTLRTLRLGAQFTKQAVEVAHRGVPTFLSTHFPNLTSLDLSVDAPLFLKSDERVTLLRRFLATHSTQLIELAVGTVDRMTWSGLSFPALSTLSFAIGGNRLNFADFPYAPQLRISFPSITQLPPRPLSSLTSIDFTFSATLQRRFDSIAQSVFQHPALQRVTWPGRLSESERVQRTYVSDMQRTFTTRSMDVKWTWEALVGWRSIETLVMSVLPDDALSATLFPRLRTVSIGGSGQPLDGRRTVRLAKEILRYHPHVTSIALEINGTYTVAKVEALVRRAIKCGVRSLTVVQHDREHQPLGTLFKAINAQGWLQVETHDLYVASSSDESDSESGSEVPVW